MEMFNVQDIITHKQKPVMVITNGKIIEHLRDENLALVLKLLRKKQMTLLEITDAFARIGEKKSEKSIYRYLNKLIKANLVIRAGKRISSINEGNLVSETIYSRYASSFIFGVTEKIKEGAIIPEFDVARLLLKKFFDDKKGCGICFSDLLNTFDIKKDQYFLDLINEADDETINLYNSLTIEQIRHVMEVVGWIAIALTVDIKDKIKKCYKDPVDI